MRATTLTTFLKAALKLQSPPYAGIRAINNTLIATDGYKMVAYTPGEGFIQGEGVIEPVNAKVLLAYEEETWVTQIRVADNAVEFDITFKSIDAPSGYALKPATIRLASFDARKLYSEKALLNLRPPKARLVAEEASVKTLRQFDTPDREKVVFDEQTATFRDAGDEDVYRYSARQVRDALSVFPARAKVSVLFGAKNELVFEEYGLLYAVCPFVYRAEEDSQ